MATNIKSRTITLSEKEGTFSAFFSRFKGKKSFSTETANFRQLLSDERARLIHTIKTKKPTSIYELAKLVGRDFKAVRYDIRLLESFGIVELISTHKKGRELLTPIIELDQLNITINL
jgi:predicted transcriptional regulator